MSAAIEVGRKASAPMAEPLSSINTKNTQKSPGPRSGMNALQSDSQQIPSTTVRCFPIRVEMRSQIGIASVLAT